MAAVKISGFGERSVGIVLALLLTAIIVMGARRETSTAKVAPQQTPPTTHRPSQTAIRELNYRPRYDVDSSGTTLVNSLVPRWEATASTEDMRKLWDGVEARGIEKIDRALDEQPTMAPKDKFWNLWTKSLILNGAGNPKQAYETLAAARTLVQSDDALAEQFLYSVIYLQGVTALRRGENDNCILCRGESSCILPIAPAAVHTNQTGSRQAIEHFQEVLARFPKDLEVRWVLNIAYMTLGEHPTKVPPQYLISLDHFRNDEFDIGRFRDIGHLVGVNNLNQAGGAIMEDFDNDGLLDIVVTSTYAAGQMRFYHNTGEGRFEDLTERAGLKGQLGGLNCVQTDYNNDGWMDIFIERGAWLPFPMRPSLLKNNRDGSFTDVTEEAGMLEPVNSISSTWADYDNDGWLDLFVCCERQRSRLYHNLQNGKFEEVALSAGVTTAESIDCKGAAWIDFDNDGYPDLFQDYFLPKVGSKLFRNNHNGTFTEVTQAQGINGPTNGFSCWAWDYDNDGWLDLFATCYERTLHDVVLGMMGLPHELGTNRLYRNLQGQGFEDVTKAAGLDKVYATMGSNFADFDNDGFLDMYLATGEPNLATLVPNRMFKNVGGKRFSEITASSGTGNLQKGHGVACGDWDRDGNVDLFIEMGGAVEGDKYHNILFQNPGHSNHWLTVKLIGEKTNRPAIGARIKLVTAADKPTEFHRHVSSGSSFGANALQQTIGIGAADRIATLEIHWPTSGTTQTFHDVAVDQAISIREFADSYESLNWKPITVPSAQDTKKMAGSPPARGAAD